LDVININDRWLESGSFVRLRNIELSYTISPSVFHRIRVENARFYVSGQNLLTITKYKGIDPALSTVNPGNNPGNNNGWMGFDFGNYPSSRTYMVGVNLTF